MKGHIKSRSRGSYTIIYDMPRGADGKRRQKSITIRGARREAEAKLAEILHQLNGGSYVEPSKVTLGEFLERWLAVYGKPNLRPHTYDDYQAIIKHHLKPTLGHIRLALLAPLDLQQYYAQALERGRADAGHQGEPLSPASVRKHHNLLHRALDHAVTWKLIARNVADAVEPPKIERPDIHPLTAADVQKFLAHAAAIPDRYALYLLAVTAGLRRGELLGLRWQDVNLEAGSLSVRKAGGRRGSQLAQVKTRASVRHIPLPPTTVEDLKRHKALQNEARLKAGPFWEDHGLVFPGPAGRPINPRNLIRQYKLLLTRAGLPLTTRFHDLRHSHATLLLEQGVHLKVVSERLGHSSVAITGDIYAHVLPTMQQEAARTLDEALFATPIAPIKPVRAPRKKAENGPKSQVL